jgi:hypothetical protein
VAAFRNLYDQNGLNEEDKAEALRIIQLIEKKEEMGIFVSDLPYEVGILQSSCSLERHMNLLTESKLVLRVGVVAARFVSFEHINPWLVQSFRLTREGKEKLEPFKTANLYTEQEETPEISHPEAVERLEECPGGTTVGRGARRKTKQLTPQLAKKPRTVNMLGPELVSLVLCLFFTMN